jgi:hypothetical protein
MNGGNNQGCLWEFQMVGQYYIVIVSLGLHYYLIRVYWFQYLQDFIIWVHYVMGLCRFGHNFLELSIISTNSK